MKQLFYCQIVLIALCLSIAMAATPIVFRLLPDDFARLSRIYEWIDGRRLNPDVAVFGDSRAMNGINGYLLGVALGENRTVASFTNPGQSFSEGALFYSSLPSDTKVVVHCIGLNTLAGPMGIAEKKVDRLLLDGYRPDSVTARFLSSSTLREFGKSRLRVLYESRTCAKTGLHNLLRKFLEPNSLSDSLDSSVYPYLYPYERAPKEQYDKYLLAQKQSPQVDLQTPDAEFETKIRAVSRYFKARHIGYYVVLMPVSPLLWDHLPQDYERCVSNFASRTEVAVFDYTKLLDDDLFCDPAHPNRAGADRITAKLADDILRDSLSGHFPEEE